MGSKMSEKITWRELAEHIESLTSAAQDEEVTIRNLAGDFVHIEKVHFSYLGGSRDYHCMWISQEGYAEKRKLKVVKP